jgi:hypothetical protein
MAFPDYVSDTNSVYSTSLAEIHRLLSEQGATRHLDDLDEYHPNYDPDTHPEATSDNALIEIKQRATSRVLEYLYPKWTIESIINVPRIRELTTYIACYLITKRRGNQPLYENEYIEALDILLQYRDGLLSLPAPVSKPRAYMISSVVDLRFTQQPVRQISAASTAVVTYENLFRPSFFWI